MSTDNEIIQVITKLNRLTQEGKIHWERMEPPAYLTTGTDVKILDFYGTEYKGRNIGIYEERYQDYDDVFGHGIYWTDRLVLAFFSEKWGQEWEFPKSTGIYELLTSIKYEVADVDTFMDEILKDGDDREED